MTPSTCKPVHYRPQYHYYTQEDYSRKKTKKTRRPVFIVSRHMDIVASVSSDFWIYTQQKSHRLSELGLSSNDPRLWLPLLPLSLSHIYPIFPNHIAGENHQVCANKNKCKLTLTYCQYGIWIYDLFPISICQKSTAYLPTPPPPPLSRPHKEESERDEPDWHLGISLYVGSLF